MADTPYSMIDAVQRRLKGRGSKLDSPVYVGDQPREDAVVMHDNLVSNKTPGSPPAGQPADSSGSDIMAKIRSLSQEQTQNPFYAAAGRALTGAGKGVAAAFSHPATGVDPGLGGIAGGLEATGEMFEQRRAEEAQSQAPFRKLVSEMVSEDIKRKVDEPYKQREREAEDARLRGRFDYEQGEREKFAREMLGGKEGAAETKPPTPDERKAAMTALFQGGNYEPSAEQVLAKVAELRRTEKKLGLRKSAPPEPPGGGQASSGGGRKSLDEIFH